MRVIKFNTLLRVVSTVGMFFVLIHPAAGQSLLNFARTTVSDQLTAGIAVTNPTSAYADVQFTLYGFDGNAVSSGLVNPVRYRVAPKGKISMKATQIFAASRVEGWVQATSSTSGLLGFYFTGDASSSLEGTEASPAFVAQTIPVIRSNQIGDAELVILNPGAADSNVTMTFFTARGQEAATVNQRLAAHGALKLRPSAIVPPAITGDLSVRISSSAPVAAAALIQTPDSFLFVAGQTVDQPASIRVAPHFVRQSGYDPLLVLTNPNASPVDVNISAFSETGGPVHPSLAGRAPRSFVVPANGSLTLDTTIITGLFFLPTIDGWLRIDTANVALNGVLLLSQGSRLSVSSLQSNALNRMVYSQISQTDASFTGLALVNPSAQATDVQVSLIQEDGRTFAQKTLSIAANSKFSALLRDILPTSPGQGGYVFVQSSAALYGIGMLGTSNGRFLTSVAPRASADAFLPSPVASRPAIISVDPRIDVRPGTTLQVKVINVVGDPVFSLNGQTISSRLLPPAAFAVDIPALEAGSANLSVRSNGLESAPFALFVLPPDNLPTQALAGDVFFQKLDVTDAGLDLGHPVMVPVRNARVEAVDRSSQAIVAVGETDNQGRFRIPVPFEPDLTIRVLSRLRFGDLRVTDNTTGNALYSISLDIDAREPLGTLVLVDNSRVSGAFNILEVVQRGNETVRMADDTVVPSPVNIFWSPRNTKALIGATFFNLGNNTAYILGDRADDSDEYDDSVIAHEYAHMLAARFSRDDSPGGSHSVGDMLDPRVAWSEGWANFFSSAVRNDAIYRDSMGVNGTRILRYDLEENIPAGDRPGYWSEASVQSLLWDLYDDHEDTADDVQFPFSLIWGAFTDLKNDRFVYLPYFLDHFLERNSSATDALRSMVQYRSIDFQPSVRPSVTNPFPRPVAVGETVTGIVDSLSSKRTNLVQSAHFFSFTTVEGAASIRLEITGLGPGNNPNANDLDLFLMDSNGKLLDRSDRGLNGQSELIPIKLSAGTYVVEVRSYYTKAETGSLVFNSGQYRLTVLVQ
ncbi:MAG TPA: PPC domain-containing protein [Terriglobia bacterium]|nr:PPC domain-containing protein [Terriglobia bacterium]